VTAVELEASLFGAVTVVELGVEVGVRFFVVVTIIEAVVVSVVKTS